MDPLLFLSTKYYAIKQTLAEYLILGWKNYMPIKSNAFQGLNNIFSKNRSIFNGILMKSIFKESGKIQKGIYCKKDRK